MNHSNKVIFSLMNDDDYKVMAEVDNKLEQGLDAETFYFNKMWKAKNGRWYEFVTNMDKCRLDHITQIITKFQLPLEAKFREDAYDMWGNLVPEKFAIWIPVNTIPDYVVKQLFDLNNELTFMYKDLLLKAGIKKEELPHITEIYLGCEKDLWPDKPWITDKIHELTTKRALTERER